HGNSFLQVVCSESSGAAELNDHGAFLSRHEMGEAGRDHDETARRVALQLGGVEPLPFAQVPGPFDDGDQFVVRVRMRPHTPARRYLHPIDPRPALAGVAEQLRPLPPVLVIRRREPPDPLRRYRDHRRLVLGRGRPRSPRENRHRRRGYKKQPFHLSLLSTWNPAMATAGAPPTCGSFLPFHCTYLAEPMMTPLRSTRGSVG